MKKIMFICLFMMTSLTSFSQAIYGRFLPKQFEYNGKKIPYRVSEPVDKSKKHPLMIFLHGAGERGNDNSKQLTDSGIGDFLQRGFTGEYESIIVTPQCPSDTYWANGISRANNNFVFDFNKEAPTEAMTMLMALIKEYIAHPNVDPTRVYIGGISMGAMTTFELLWRMPNTFAAAFPICGGSTVNQTKLELYASHTPLWIFHGDADDVVNVDYSRDVYNKLIQIKNNNVKYTEYNRVNHTSWYNAFNEKALIPWLFGYVNLNAGHYKIASVNGNQSLTKTNAKLTLNDFTGGKTQTWLISPHEGHLFKIQATDGSNQYLSVDGTNLGMSATANTVNQYWKLKQSSEKGVFNIISEANKMVLTLTGSNVALAANSASSNQKWKINHTTAYLIGGATPNGWVQNGAQEMVPVPGKDGVLTWKGVLRTSDFKFATLKNSWLPAINAIRANEPIVSGIEQKVIENTSNSSYDHKFIIKKAGCYEVELNTIDRTVRINEKLLDDIYLVGNAAPCGWNANDPIKLSPVDGKNGVFTWQGQMTVGDFKFITNKSSWSPSINPESTQNISIGSPMKLNITNGVEGDYKFSITRNSYYIFTVDVKNWTLVITEKIVKTPLYLVGDATPNGWDNTTATPMAQELDGVYTWQGKLTAGHFKFITQLGTWNSIVPTRKVHEPVITGYYHDISPNYQGDYRFVIPETGTYDVKVDMNKYTMRVTKLPSNNLIYLVGDATPNGWNNTIATPMKEVSNGVFTWTGTLLQKEFKFITKLGTWDSLVPTSASNEKVVVGTTHNISNNYQGDYRFVMPKQGVYTITVNLNNRVMSIVESLLKSRIEENVNADYYTIISNSGYIEVKLNKDIKVDHAVLMDISGRTIASEKNKDDNFNLGNNLSSGIYIVKLTRNKEVYVQKILIK